MAEACTLSLSGAPPGTDRRGALLTDLPHSRASSGREPETRSRGAVVNSRVTWQIIAEGFSDANSYETYLPSVERSTGQGL